MKKVCILGVMAWITVVALAWNVSLAECESNWIFYDTWANVTYIDTNGKSFTWIGTITVCYSWEEITLLDRNLGASMTWYWKDAPEESYGYYFQWGNNYGFSVGDVSSNKMNFQMNTSWYSWNKPYVSSGYVTANKDWRSISNGDLWGGKNDTKSSWNGNLVLSYQRQWPCPDGYHIPSQKDWNDLVAYYANYYGQYSWLNKGTRFKYSWSWQDVFVDGMLKDMHIPLWWWIDISAQIWKVGQIAYLWSSYPWWVIYWMQDSTNNSFILDTGYTWYWRSIRCFKDVEPYYVLSFDTNGWIPNKIQSQTVPQNGSGHLLWIEPTKDGATFLWWYMDLNFDNSAFDTDSHFTTFALTEDTIIYAKRNKNVVTFDPQEFWENVVSQYFDFGSVVDKPVLNVPGYGIKRCKTPECSEWSEWDFENDTLKYDLTLYATGIKYWINSWLILYYNFDWDSVNWNDILDLSEKNNTWIANGWVMFNVYNDEGSAEFRWTWNIVFQDYGDSIEKTNEWSLSLWVKPFSTGDQIIIWSSFWPALWFFKDTLIWFSALSGGKYQTDLKNLNIWEWNNIVVVLSGNNVSYYINWVKVDRFWSQYRTWKSLSGKIWSRDTGDMPFSWYLDEIRVYDRVLSTDEISELYNKWFRPWKIECNVIYSKNEWGIDAVLDCPRDVVLTSAWENHTFTESGSYLFEYEYWWGTGSVEASVNKYTVKFKTSNKYWALSWITTYSVLAYNNANLQSLGIVVPELIPMNEYYVGARTWSLPIGDMTVNDNLVFTAEFHPIHDDNNNWIADEEEKVPTPELKVSWWWSWWWGHRAVSDNSSDRGSDFNGEVEITYEDEYSLEMNEAYQFAFENWITTKETINDADMDWALTRVAMAKMLSQYAINVLWKAPANLIVPKFVDVTDEMNEQYNYGVSLAYQLWIMWINMPDNKFRPNDLVTRAEFGTALSRMLYGITDWEDSYYSTHLDRLYEEWIITNQNPNLQELRGYVMLMLMRSKK